MGCSVCGHTSPHLSSPVGPHKTPHPDPTILVSRYAATDPGAQRELRFWGVIGPCIARYVWVGKTVDDPTERRQRYDELHDAYATPVVDLFMELGGPYIKLGQVQSVSTICVCCAFTFWACTRVPCPECSISVRARDAVGADATAE